MTKNKKGEHETMEDKNNNMGNGKCEITNGK